MHGVPISGFGQRIDSDRPIDGAVPADAAGAADIVIRHHAPAELTAVDLYTRCEDELIFAPPRAGLYRCRTGSIDVTPRPDADPAEVAALLIATALPAVLWLQKRFVLHAAAVRLAGRDAAIAIAGPSGVGKSSVAAALLERGADLVADDSIALSDRAIASGLPGGLFETTGPGQRRFVAVPAARALAAVPLAALFVLSRGAGSCTRLAPLEATQELLRHRHRPRVPALLGRLGAGLATSALLSGAVPVYAWPRPVGAIRLDDREWQMLMTASQRRRD